MSTETAPETTHEAHDAHEESHDHGFSDQKYIQIAIVLAVITALEVYASYAGWLGAAFIPLLIFMMIAKFVIVALFFMHLKFDSKVFSWMFYAGLFLALGVYVATLATFKFFNS
jgi:cytochrome c oxidase subunit 4